MSEASDRLRRLESDHSPDGWPAVQMRDITSVLDELDAMYAARAATEVPIVDQLLAERDAMHEGQQRLTAIYVERGRTIEMMRNLMNSCH